MDEGESTQMYIHVCIVHLHCNSYIVTGQAARVGISMGINMGIKDRVRESHPA